MIGISKKRLGKKYSDLEWPFVFFLSVRCRSPMLLPRPPWLHPALATQQEEEEVEEAVMEEG